MNTGIKTYKKRDEYYLAQLIAAFVFAVKNLCPGLPITIVGSMNKYSQKFNDIGCNVTEITKTPFIDVKVKICVSLSRVDNFQICY